VYMTQIYTLTQSTINHNLHAYYFCIFIYFIFTINKGKVFYPPSSIEYAGYHLAIGREERIVASRKEEEGGEGKLFVFRMFDKESAYEG